MTHLSPQGSPSALNERVDVRNRATVDARSTSNFVRRLPLVARTGQEPHVKPERQNFALRVAHLRGKGQSRHGMHVMLDLHLRIAIERDRQLRLSIRWPL